MLYYFLSKINCNENMKFLLLLIRDFIFCEDINYSLILILKAIRPHYVAKDMKRAKSKVRQWSGVIKLLHLIKIRGFFGNFMIFRETGGIQLKVCKIWCLQLMLFHRRISEAYTNRYSRDDWNNWLKKTKLFSIY